jgi:hypothetical protein
MTFRAGRLTCDESIPRFLREVHTIAVMIQTHKHITHTHTHIHTCTRIRQHKNNNTGQGAPLDRSNCPWGCVVVRVYALGRLLNNHQQWRADIAGKVHVHAYTRPIHTYSYTLTSTHTHTNIHIHTRTRAHNMTNAALDMRANTEKHT